MKIGKILAAIACIVLICTVAIVPAFAASDVNANEQEIYDKLKNGIQKDGKKVNFEKEVVGSIYNYLIRDDVDITAEQKAEILGYIDAAYNVFLSSSQAADENSKFVLSKMSVEEKTALLDNFRAAGHVAGLTTVYTAEDNVITMRDASGAVVCKTGAVLKQTGSSSNVALYAIAAAVVLLLAGAVVVGKKVRN